MYKTGFIKPRVQSGKFGEKKWEEIKFGVRRVIG